MISLHVGPEQPMMVIISQLKDFQRYLTLNFHTNPEVTMSTLLEFRHYLTQTTSLSGQTYTFMMTPIRYPNQQKSRKTSITVPPSSSFFYLREKLEYRSIFQVQKQGRSSTESIQQKAYVVLIIVRYYSVYRQYGKGNLNTFIKSSFVTCQFLIQIPDPPSCPFTYFNYKTFFVC